MLGAAGAIIPEGLAANGADIKVSPAGSSCLLKGNALFSSAPAAAGPACRDPD